MTNTFLQPGEFEKIHSKILESSSGPLRLDHIGIAVKSLVQSRVFYETLGMSASTVETVEQEQVRTIFFELGESRLELLEPTAEDSTIGRFLTRRGEGLHHIALVADNLPERFADMQRKGVRMASEKVQIGAGGHRYFFVHPASTGGVLVEFVDATVGESAGSMSA